MTTTADICDACGITMHRLARRYDVNTTKCRGCSERIPVAAGSYCSERCCYETRHPWVGPVGDAMPQPESAR